MVYHGDRAKVGDKIVNERESSGGGRTDSIKTAVNKSVGVKSKTVPTQTDVAASYQKSQKRSIVGATTTDSVRNRDSYSSQTQTQLNTVAPTVVKQDAQRTYNTSRSLPATTPYTPQSIITQEDIANSYQRRAEQGVEQSKIGVTNLTDDSNMSIKAAVDSRVNSEKASSAINVRTGQRLSEAFALSQMLSSSALSNDAKSAIREVKEWTGGDIVRLKAYLDSKPTNDQMKFNQEIATRQIKASFARDEIKELLKKPTLKESGNSIRMEIVATYHETLLKYAKRPQTFKSFFADQIKTRIIPSIGMAASEAGGILSKGDDSGSQAIGVAMTAGQGAIIFGKGLTKAYISVSEIPFTLAHKVVELPDATRRFAIGVKNETGEFVQSVKNFRIRVVNLPKNIKDTGRRIKTAVDNNVEYAKRATRMVKKYGLLSKPVLSRIGYTALKPVKKVAKESVLIGGRAVAHTATKGAVTLAKRGLPTIVGGTSAVALGVGSALGKSEDETVRGAGTLMTGVGYGIKTGVTVTKASGYAIKTAVNTTMSGVTAVAEEAEIVAAIGWKNSLRYARQRIYKKTYDSVRKSIEETERAIVNIIKTISKKSVIPIVIILCVAIVSVAVTTPISVVGGLFSGTFSTIATVAQKIPIIGGLFKEVEEGDIVEYDIEKYLSDKDKGIPHLKEVYIKEVADYWNSQDCDYLRVKTEGYSGVVGRKDSVGGIEAAIRSVFYSDEELVRLIQPIFNAVVLTKYDLQPTDEQAEKVLKDIFNSLFPKPKNISHTTITEHCGQSALFGTGIAYVDSGKCVKCGKVHNEICSGVRSSCPHYSTYYHSSYVCCCDSEWYTCQEIKANGGSGNNVQGLNGEIVMKGSEPLRIYGHWTGYAKKGYAGSNVCQIQHFRQHGCSKLNQKDHIIRVILMYNSSGTGEYTRWSTETDYPTAEDYRNGYWIVDGEKYYIDEPCNNSEYHFECQGYDVCNGHKVILLNFNLSGYDKLVEENFTKPIQKLTDKGEEELSEDEKSQLQSLKDGKELALEYLLQENESLVAKSELYNIEWATKEEDLTSEQKTERERAISQVGKVGGKTYIDWYYNQISKSPPKEVDWSGCFVCWVKKKPNFANPLEAYNIDEFEGNNGVSNSEFVSAISKLDSGDVVFFSVTSGNKNKPDHCGYVIGRDAEYIYVIEGNRFDTVAICKYSFDDSRICDYSKRGEDWWK